jgi:lipoyl synthase
VLHLDLEPERDADWRVSSGSAAVLGLSHLQMDAAPTTAYVMLGERCARNCAFCAQAHSSRANAAALSRVTWPAFDPDTVAQAIGSAHARGAIRRACFQVTVSRDHIARTCRAVRALAEGTTVPVCASILPRSAEDVATVLAAGAERVTIALDAASERVYQEMKGGAWQQTLRLLEICGRLYPGHIGTHLIVGLGETERELVTLTQELADLGVAVALFAFTPVHGTPLQSAPPPTLGHYRRMQTARWLIVNALARANDFVYDAHRGMLLSFGVSAAHLQEMLAGGEAFRTSGCPDCNRPYYNERPGGVMYNYPRPLTHAEAEREVAGLLETLADC